MTAFAYQLYSSRNFPPLDRTLAMLAEVGYGAVEGYGALLANDEAIATLEVALGQTGLAMPSAHIGLDRIQTESEAVLAITRRLGIQTIIVPYLVPDDRPSDAKGWRAFADEVAEAGKPLVDAGLSFGWHNHDFEFEVLPTGERPIDILLSAGDHVQLEFDLAWAVRAGEDPALWLECHGARLCAAHIKDIAPEGERAGEDGWADVGHGTLDWDFLYARLKALDVPSLIVEHDNPSDDRRFATRSIASLRAYDA